MNTRGPDELENAQIEIARAIRKLASGLDPVAVSAHAGRPPSATARLDDGKNEEPGTNLTQRLLERLRLPGREFGESGGRELSVNELPIDRESRDVRRINRGGVEDRAPGDRINAHAFTQTAAADRQFSDAFEPVTRAVTELTAAVGVNTRTIGENTSELASGLRAVLGGFLQPDRGNGGFLSFIKGGLGVAPLALQIAGLFGKKREDPETPRLFDLPASIAIEAANSEGALSGLRRTDRDQFGQVRTESGVSRRDTAPAQQPQVIVNVSAMDSQSFMDRSTDIARALRDAMLHMHPVNDVIGEI